MYDASKVVNRNITPIILCGGNGTRLWPLSREQQPKQLLKLINEKTLLQNTIDRVSNYNKPNIVANINQEILLKGQINNDDINAFLFEPVARGTLPAIVIASLIEHRIDPDSVVLTLPADHVINDKGAFEDAINVAYDLLVGDNNIVCFGVKPIYPDTGYGYIKCNHTEILEFVEKPNLDKATEYVRDGNYYWNSGIYLFKTSVLIDEVRKINPELIKICEACLIDNSLDLNNSIYVDKYNPKKASYDKLENISIDYGLMEITKKAVLYPLASFWTDIGSYKSLYDCLDKDDNGNVTKGDICTIDSNNNYVNSDNKLVALLGVDDLVVVDTKDVTFITTKERSQDVRKMVDKLNLEKREETKTSSTVLRPWGYYEVLSKEPRYQVKRICLYPGNSISLQLHYHRSEHWTVVNGTAEVVCDDKTFLLTENQSTYIPLGSVHKLKNIGKLLLEVIEVQSGTYLGEDDIIRLCDDYGRK